MAQAGAGIPSASFIFDRWFSESSKRLETECSLAQMERNTSGSFTMIPRRVIVVGLLVKLIRKQLVTNDASQRPIAVYHRKHHGYFHPKREAFLEVLPQAEHMLDIVLITYVFVEKIRKENEEAAATV